jgi:serine/threonine protein kinase
MSNDQAYRLARKDFELNAEDKAHEKERDVLREIVRNAKRHTNIMKSLGSLENGSIYSIFMPLADCDLKQYMERHPPPASPMQKASFVQCAVGLAGAIVYLHEELESPVYEKLSCFHMDLKPQNILVVINPETEQHSWKLSDFNMSRVKMKRNPAADHLTLRRSSTFGDNVYEVNKLFKRRIPDAAARSVTDYTINRRGTGTYLAPEACVEGHPVQAESDIWSLGCVISVVFSYLYGGQAAVEEYSQLRGKNDVDSFFSFSNGKSAHKLSDAQVSDAVKKWHRHLRMRIKQERPDESHIFEAVINFLDRKVLIVDPKHRRETTANDVRLKLIEAFNLFRTIADQPPISPSSPGHRFSIPFFGKRSKRRQSEIEAQSQEWKIPLPAPVQACAFGPNAEPLVCMTDRTLSIFSFEHVLLSLDSGHLDNNMIEYGQASPEHKWRNWIPIIGVSSRYILAATNHHDFDVSIVPIITSCANTMECYFYHIPQPGSHNTEIELVAHWQLKMPKIWRLAISPDARYAAFVLFSAFSQDRNAMLYVTRLDWLQGADSERYMLGEILSPRAKLTLTAVDFSRLYRLLPDRAQPQAPLWAAQSNYHARLKTYASSPSPRSMASTLWQSPSRVIQ